MTKRYDEAIEVTPDPHDDGAPVAFLWRGRRYRVDQRLGDWRETTWGGSPGRNETTWGGSPGRNETSWGGSTSQRDREYYRILARPAETLATGDLDPDGYLRGSLGAVYDVYRDRILGAWKLARIWD